MDCSVCTTFVEINEYTLIPARCKRRHGLRGHPICFECWFYGKNEPAFADEFTQHDCPGCIKNLPLII